MAARNDITGDAIQTKLASQAYLDNFEGIFGKRKKKEEKIEEPVKTQTPDSTGVDTSGDI